MKGPKYSLTLDPRHQLPDLGGRVVDDVGLASEALKGVDALLCVVLNEEVLPVHLGQFSATSSEVEDPAVGQLAREAEEAVAEAVPVGRLPLFGGCVDTVLEVVNDKVAKLLKWYKPLVQAGLTNHDSQY